MLNVLAIVLSVSTLASASALEAHARGEPIARLPASCPDGEYLTDTACLPCPEGYFCISSEPRPCPAGTTAPAGSSECTPCPNGFICNAFRTIPALVPRQSSSRRDTAPPSKRDGAVYPRQSPMKRDAAPPSQRDTGVYPRQSSMKRDSSSASKRDSALYPRQSSMKRDVDTPSKRETGIYARQSPMKRDTAPPSKRDSGVYPRQSPMKRDTALLPRQSGINSGRRDAGSDPRQNQPARRGLPVDEPLAVYDRSSAIDEPVVQLEELPASAPLMKRDDATCMHRGEISCPSVRGHGSDCINPMSDLESCGGCVIPDDFGVSDGVDCTALEGVDNVKCVRGTCLISSCGRGYKFSHNGMGCVRLEGDPRNLHVQV